MRCKCSMMLKVVAVVELSCCVRLFCGLMDYCLPGSSVHGISQARILEWVVISSPEDLLTQGLNLGLLLWHAGSLPLNHLGRPLKEVLITKTVYYVLAQKFFFVLVLIHLFLHLTNIFFNISCLPGGSDLQTGDLGSRPGFNPWVRKILWRTEWPPTPVFLPGELHGQRSLASYIPWGHKESDTAD